MFSSSAQNATLTSSMHMLHQLEQRAKEADLAEGAVGPAHLEADQAQCCQPFVFRDLRFGQKSEDINQTGGKSSVEVFCQRLHGFQFRIITRFGFAGESNLGLLFAPRTCIVQKCQDSVRGCLTCLKHGTW